MTRRAFALLAVLATTIPAAACASGDTSATRTPPPNPTSTAAPDTPTPFPAFTPTPALDAGAEIVVGGDLQTRGAPNTHGPVVGTLKDLAHVQIVRAAQGENWLVGSQTWVSDPPDWTRTWYQLSDGTYVYAAFIFILQPGEVSPLIDPQGRERWVEVNVTSQTVGAMIGDRAIYAAPISSGLPQFPSPMGTHHIEQDGRLPVERMTASQAGYSPGQATYDVERVLFTQYYDRNGDALHLNYWRPKSVFGRTPTSHGCIGMQLHDAQYFWLFGFPGMRVEVHT